ncbi:acyclic terpene utilization AtuA family protein [Lichenihabitans psoromatis]|uniref:acyclic terpene utilization AtuA family protein n=1 Tax=Lichenihabitans psoromatis TaxID=2528642 RepID=UPI001A947B80|nr:acyclic terpene utilization AtuA family protein [Lichenihabitans psoromatis]
MAEVRLLSTTAILGYGFPAESLTRGMARRPDLIGADAGSVDPGPYYLGSGKGFTSPRAVKRDLQLMLRAASDHGVPVVISTAGGAGGQPHLEATAAIAREIAAEDKLGFKMALIGSEQDQELLATRAEAGQTKPLAGLPPLTRETIEASTRIVGLMGPEPYRAALDAGAQVIIAGRSTDPAPWAAAVLRGGLGHAEAWYAGKMLECGAEPALPKKEDCLFVTVGDGYVECEPTNPIRRCTPLSVANFALHENSSPIRHIEPGGILDTSDCRFDAVSDRAVRISGMRWEPAERLTIKLEGVELAGFRSITICATRDPVLIANIEPYLAKVREVVADKSAAFGIAPEAYRLIIRSYGLNGVMGDLEPLANKPAHELCFVVEAVCETQEQAAAVIGMARLTMLHSDFAGRLCKEGNMAIPFSPSDIDVGPMYRFNVFHTVEAMSPTELFPITYETV